MSSVGTLEFCTLVYWFSPGLAGQACSQASCPPQELPEGIADDRAPVRAGAEVALDGLRVGHPDAGKLAPGERRGGG